MRAACIVLCSVLAAPVPALAHAILLESTPALGAAVPPGATRIVLRFNSRIDQARSRVELRGGPAPVTLPLAPAPGPDILALQTDLRPGKWVIRWQVLAVDGHITRGDVPLTVQ